MLGVGGLLVADWRAHILISDCVGRSVAPGAFFCRRTRAWTLGRRGARRRRRHCEVKNAAKLSVRNADRTGVLRGVGGKVQIAMLFGLRGHRCLAFTVCARFGELLDHICIDIGESVKVKV